ncbi:MAG TPA: hypothetical protein VLL54_14380 [Pyrinomonadaceae bacterium]|nr:hypothetical protein [Pyrinomonadaceae bacterium]
MKKKVLFLATAGFAAGLAYALKSKRSKTPTSNVLQGDGELGPRKRRSKSSASKRDHSFEQSTSATRGNGKTAIAKETHQLDDHGTNQAEALHILKEIRDTGFGASDEKLALALGRPTEEIVQGLNGEALIDGDLVIKARALAMQRGLEIQ